MELPIYNNKQPGCTYYFSPLSMYNLGMVNHAHKYDAGKVSEHMYAHVYHAGIAKNGANNVASLIMKTLGIENPAMDVQTVQAVLNILNPQQQAVTESKIQISEELNKMKFLACCTVIKI